MLQCVTACKLIFLEVFVDADLVKALIKAYNHVTKAFHKHDGSILCTLDKTSFIEDFGLEGQMSVQIDVDELQVKFKTSKSYYTRKVMIHHILYNLKKVGDIPKEVVDTLPLRKFNGYF